MVAISKLSKLNNPESFLQLNLIKGFKYVDLAGEIVNKFYTKDSPPNFQMGLDGLTIKKPTKDIEELKITPVVLWAKFINNPSFDKIEDLFNDNAKSILNTLKVERINRVGWRNYFIYTVDTQNKIDEYFKKYFNPSTLKITSYACELNTNKSFKANLTVQPVVKKDSHNAKGLLFDVDIFQTGDFSPSDIKNILTSYREFMANKGDLMSILNTTFL
jgi:hypothetical protein